MLCAGRARLRLQADRIVEHPGAGRCEHYAIDSGPEQRRPEKSGHNLLPPVGGLIEARVAGPVAEGEAPFGLVDPHGERRGHLALHIHQVDDETDGNGWRFGELELYGERMRTPTRPRVHRSRLHEAPVAARLRCPDPVSHVIRERGRVSCVVARDGELVIAVVEIPDAPLPIGAERHRDQANTHQ